MLSDAKISDLFFNYQNENYEEVFKGNNPPSSDDIEDSIKKDAAEFANMYPEFGKDAEWYAKDFLARL